jgi:hypothetical protein
MVFLTADFGLVFPEKRLELKSLKGWTKAEELGDLVLEASVAGHVIQLRAGKLSTRMCLRCCAII